MTLCLVTDRRRLAGAGAPLAEARACLVAQARFAAEAGVDLLQVRERDLEAADLASVVRAVIAAVNGSRTLVLVNDRLDVALACGAAGVHLRGDSLPVDAARRIAPAGFLVGRSVHGLDEARAVAGADYLIAGTVFPSRSKESGSPCLGLDGLEAIVKSVAIPVLAIGGVTEELVAALARAGAAGCAAIGAFIGDDPDAPAPCRAMPLGGWVDRARQRFDAAKLALK